jgi:hypothetical protein
MIYGGVWNRSIDTFGATLIILECINLSRIFENKYRDEFGKKFKRKKHARGTKKYEKREIVDYLRRMSKTVLGKPSRAYVESLLSDEWRGYFDDILTLPESESDAAMESASKTATAAAMKPVMTVKRRVEDLHLTAVMAAAADEHSSAAVETPSPTLLTQVFGGRRRGSGTVRITRTLSEANQTAPFCRRPSALVAEYFQQYAHFIDAKLIEESDLKRLKVCERLCAGVLIWDVAKRTTPEQALEAFFKFDRDYMLKCLDMKYLQDEYQSRDAMAERRKRERKLAAAETHRTAEMVRATRDIADSTGDDKHT